MTEEQALTELERVAAERDQLAAEVRDLQERLRVSRVVLGTLSDTVLSGKGTYSVSVPWQGADGWRKEGGR